MKNDEIIERTCHGQKAEEAVKKFEVELETSKYTVTKLSDVEASSPTTTLYVIGNGFDLAHGVPSSYSKFRDWLGRHSDLRKVLETYIRNDAMEYFGKIRSVVHRDAKWIYSCHDSGGLKAVDAFVKIMGINTDKVTVFRL